MTVKLSEPDYLFWSKWDEWTFKEAALLLHGFEPLNFREIKFNANKKFDTPELKEAYKTFLFLKKIKWTELGTVNNNSVHPFDIQKMFHHKDLSIPEKLNEFLEIRRKREEINTNLLSATTSQSSNHENNKESLAYNRERKNLLRTIGLLVLLLEDNKEQSSKVKQNRQVIASQVRELILQKAMSLKIDDDGLKSINRKITEAVALVNNEANLETS